MVFYHCFAFFYPVDVATSNKMNKKNGTFYRLVVEWLTRCSDKAKTPSSTLGEPTNVFLCVI